VKKNIEAAFRFIIENVSMISLGLLMAGLPFCKFTKLVDAKQPDWFITFSVISVISILLAVLNFFGKIQFRVTKVDLYVFSIFSVISVSYFFTQPYRPFSLNYYEAIGLCINYILLRQLSFIRLVFVLFFMFFGIFLQCIYGQSQLLGIFSSNHGIFKVTGSFSNPGPYAGYLVAGVPALLLAYLNSNFLFPKIFPKRTVNRRGVNYLLLIFLLFLSIMIFSTQSRASWLAAITSIIYILKDNYHIKSFVCRLLNTRKKRIIFSGAIVVFVSIAISFAFNFKKSSASGRLFVWTITGKTIFEKPLTGVGFDRFQSIYMAAQAAHFKERVVGNEVDIADSAFYAFNDFLQFTAENGIVAICLLFVFIYTIFRDEKDFNLTTEKKILVTGIRSGVLAIGIFAFFSYPSQILPIKLNLILLISIISHLVSSTVYKCSLKKNQYSLPLMVLVFALVFYVGAVSLKKLNSLNVAFEQWDEATFFYNDEDFTQAVKIYKKFTHYFQIRGLF
jgi:O-antigen ligase